MTLSRCFTVRLRAQLLPSFSRRWGKRSGAMLVLCGSCASISALLCPSPILCAEGKRAKEEHVDELALRDVSLAELQQHNSESSCWVSYGGVVYDVTAFLQHHPGGNEPLLMAGGHALENFWKLFPIHLERGKAMEELERCPKVGRLVPGTQDQQQPWTNIDSFKRIQRRQTKDLVCCALLGMVLDVVILCARVLGWLGFRSLVDDLAAISPVAIPGYGWSRPLDRDERRQKAPARIAVVGGGIAGCACAYSLQKAGFHVTLFESRSELGGNAQIGTFTAKGSHGTTTVSQDLSVLYWCPMYYRNYMALLDAINVRPSVVSLPYVIKTNSKNITPADSSTPQSEWHYYTPPGTPLHGQITSDQLMKRFHNDFVKFDRMVRWVKKINNFFCMDSEPSFYKAAGVFNRVNPLNYMSFRGITKVFLISDEFYETIIRPFHGVQFTTHEIDHVPAAAWAVLDEIVPLTKSRTHMSWGPGNSREVFEKMTKDCDVRLNTRVRGVATASVNGGEKGPQGQLSVSYDDPKSNARREEVFDRVVLAVSSQYAANIVASQCNHGTNGGGLASFFAQTILRAVQYHDDVVHGDWNLWAEVPVHQDGAGAIDDPTHREKLLQQAAFVCDHDAAHSGNIMYHSIVSSWSPAAKKAFAAAKCTPPMIMTQCVHPHIHIDPAKVVRRFSAPRAHPDMSMKNMVITQMLRHLQGRDGVYFCGNWTAPGNGHDLSLTSGLVVASAIVKGGFYPFDADEKAKKDFKMMQRFMGIS